MRSDNWALGWCFIGRFRGLGTVAVHRSRCGTKWLCKSQFLLACCTFRVCHRLTDIWALGRYYFCSFCARCAVYAHMRSYNYHQSYLFHSFSRIIFSKSVIYSLVYRYCSGVSFFLFFLIVENAYEFGWLQKAEALVENLLFALQWHYCEWYVI